MKKNLSIIFLLLLALTSSFSRLQAQCVPPSNFWVAPMDANGRSVLVMPMPSAATAYVVEYRSANDSIWQTVRVTASSNPMDTVGARITNLAACTAYQFRMRAVCGNDLSPYTAIQTHQTAGCNTCPAPGVQFFGINNTGTNVAVWVNATGATRAAVQYRVSGTATWTETPARLDTLGAGIFRADISLLNTCANYEIRAYTVCNGTTSEFSRSQTHRTTGCATADSCTAPRNVMGMARDTGITVLWASNAVTGTWTVQYRVADAATWQTVTTSRPGVMLSGLANCTLYEIRVRTNCNTSSSAFGNIIRVKTLGCPPPCIAPRNLRAISNANGTAFNVTWTAVSANALYQVQYRIWNDTAWQTLSTRSTVLSIGGIRACTPYQFRVRVRCGDNLHSDYSAMYAQTSAGCPSSRCALPRALRATVSGTNTILVSWDSTTSAASVAVRYRTERDSTWRTVTAQNGSIVSIPNLVACTRYIVQVRATCSATSSSDWSVPFVVSTPCQTACAAPVGLVAASSDSAVILVWRGNATAYNLQYRRNGDSLWTSVRTTTPQYQLLNLSRCAVYQYRVQSVCSNSFSEWSSISRFETRGCVPNPTGCPVPRNVTTQRLSDSMVLIVWQGTLATIPVRYRVVVTGMGIVRELTADSTDIVVTLPSCGTYTVKVRTICTSGNSDWTTPITFTTNCGSGTTCSPLVNVIASSTPNGTTLTWQGSNDTRYYSYRYYRVGDTTSMVWDTTSGTTLNLRNLVACGTYTAVVTRFCANGGSVSSTVTFRAYGANCLQSGGSSEVARNFQIYPNPSATTVHVAYELERAADVTFDFVNLQGQKVLTFDAGNQTAGAIRQTIEAATNLQNGVYFINLRADGQLIQTQKFFKQ